MAAWYAMELQHPGTGSGDSYAVPGTDRSGRCDRGPERGEGGRTDLVEPGASLVPVLRGRRGSHHHGPVGQLSHGLGTGARGIPGHVRSPPLLPVVLWPNGGKPTPGSYGPSRCGGSVRIQRSVKGTSSLHGVAARLSRTCHLFLSRGKGRVLRWGDLLMCPQNRSLYLVVILPPGPNKPGGTCVGLFQRLLHRQNIRVVHQDKDKRDKGSDGKSQEHSAAYRKRGLLIFLTSLHVLRCVAENRSPVTRTKSEPS